MVSFFEGLSSGFQVGRDLGHKKAVLAENARQFDEDMYIKEGYLGLEKDKFGFEKEKFNQTFDFQKEQYYTQRADNLKAQARAQQAQADMALAFKQGGTPGLINHLMGTDPKTALELMSKQSTMEKTAIEANKLQQETEITKLDFIDKMNAVVGKIGLGVKNAKDPSAAYKKSIPILQKFFGDTVPKEYNKEAQDIFDLAVGNAVPAAQLYKDKELIKEYKTDTAKLIGDKQRLLEEGYSPDSLEIQSINAKLSESIATTNKIQAEALEKMLPADTTGQENVLRGEFVKLTDDFRKVQDSYNRIQASIPAPGERPGISDVALIFNFMKMLDPGSVVRESEFMTVGKAGGLPQQVQIMFNRLDEGGFLEEGLRKDVIRKSDALYQAQQLSYQRLKEDYTQRAQRKGINIKDVIVEQEALGEKREPQIPQEAIDFYKSQDPTLTDEELLQLYKRDQGYQ